MYHKKYISLYTVHSKLYKDKDIKKTRYINTHTRVLAFCKPDPLCSTVRLILVKRLATLTTEFDGIRSQY